MPCSGLAQLGRRPGALQRVALVGVKPPPLPVAATAAAGSGGFGGAVAAPPAAAEIARLQLFQAHLFRAAVVIKAGPLQVRHQRDD